MTCFLVAVFETKAFRIPSWAHLASIVIPISPILDCVVAEPFPIFVLPYLKFFHLFGVYDPSCSLVVITASAFHLAFWISSWGSKNTCVSFDVVDVFRYKREANCEPVVQDITGNKIEFNDLVVHFGMVSGDLALS